MKLDPTELDRSGRNAAITPARHAARHGASLHQIIEALAYLHINEPLRPGRTTLRISPPLPLLRRWAFRRDYLIPLRTEGSNKAPVPALTSILERPQVAAPGLRAA